MENRKKLNKLKVTIVIMVIILTVAISVFGRYIYNMAKDAYFVSKQFYFTSDILSTAGSEYQYTSWDGEEAYQIEIELYSYMNERSKLDYDLEYTISCSTEDTDKVTCTVNSNEDDASNTATGTIYTTTHTSRVVIFVTPLEKVNENDSVTINITASTSEPYQKTLSGEITLKVENKGTTIYSIEDVKNRDYAILSITNSGNDPVKYTLTFDPSKLRIDMNDEVYVNRESETLDSNNYVKSIVFELDEETTKHVKFYKVTKSENYTYPGVNGTSAITVSI